MGQVIQDTPDDPIGYIIKVLQEMHKRQSKQLNSSLVSLSDMSIFTHNTLGKILTKNA